MKQSTSGIETDMNDDQKATDTTTVTEQQNDEYLAYSKVEIDALNDQIAAILGEGWESEGDKMTKLAKDVRKCCKNKIYMRFVVLWHPGNVDFRKEYENALTVYCHGWGVLMNEVVTNKMTKQ